MAFINSLPWALFLQTLDFYYKLANNFNKVVYLACMPRDSTPPSPQDTGALPLNRSPPHLKRHPLKNELLPTPLKNVAPSWEMIPRKKSKYILKTTIYLLGGCPMACLLCYYSIFLSTFKPKVNFLGLPYLPPCIDQNLSVNFEAPPMREHSPMF